MRVAFDTNVAVYALLDHRDRRKTNVAQNLFREAAQTSSAVLSAQVLKEFANVAIKKHLLAENVLLEYLDGLGKLRIVPETSEVVRYAIERHFASKISFYDALVVESAIAAEANVLYSEDLQHGAVFGSVRVINPFR